MSTIQPIKKCRYSRNTYFTRHGGVAQRPSHPPQEQKTRVRIPPGYKVFWEKNIAMLLCKIDLIFIVCCKGEIKALAKKYI
jgi:hypothetical protein